MGTLKQASQKAKAKFNSTKPNAAALIGSLGVSKLQVDTDSLLTAMETAIGEFISRVITNIDSAVGKTGAPLINTGDITNISAEQTGDSWQIKAPAHLDFQSKGVSGTERQVPNSPYKFSGNKKSVNLDAIKLWIKQRGITFEGLSEDQTAYLIGRSIYRQGIDPKMLWENEVEKLKEDIGEEIAKQIAASVAGNPIKKDIKIQ